MSTAKMFGVLPHMSQANSDFSASTGSSNPTNQWYWILSAACADLSSTGSVIWVVHVDYYVEFFERTNVQAQ